MNGVRFTVKKKGNMYFLFDNKTQEYYNDILTDTHTLNQFTVLLNVLDDKNKRCAESNKKLQENNCELRKKVKELSNHIDPVELNRYWELMTNG